MSLSLTSQREEFLSNINNKLKQLVDEATVDFISVNSVLKKYYDAGGGAGGMEPVVYNLQYMDIFRQRVEHIIAAHELVMKNAGPVPHESLFHLHCFQLQTAQMDLLAAVELIANTFSDLKEFLTTEAKVEWPAGGFFSHIVSIKDGLTNVASSLAREGGETAVLSTPPFLNDSISVLQSLYTMERERIVLTWFVQAMPASTWKHLEVHYKEATTETVEENTELF